MIKFFNLEHVKRFNIGLFSDKYNHKVYGGFMNHYESDQGNLDIVLLGDCILTRKLSVFREPSYLEMIDMIRTNDLVLANSEMLFHEYDGTPAWDHGGTHMASDPNNISELHWLGVNMVSCANNHANDYGPRGVIALAPPCPVSP